MIKINLKEYLLIEFLKISAYLIYGFIISLIIIISNINDKNGLYILLFAYIIELILKIINLMSQYKNHSITDKILLLLLKLFKINLKDYNYVVR